MLDMDTLDSSGSVSHLEKGNNAFRNGDVSEGQYGKLNKKVAIHISSWSIQKQMSDAEGIKK